MGGQPAKLLPATRSDADPLSRLIVELLAPTGIRRSELLALTVDAVVQIGSAYWLRIPNIGGRTSPYKPVDMTLWLSSTLTVAAA